VVFSCDCLPCPDRSYGFAQKPEVHRKTPKRRVSSQLTILKMKRTPVGMQDKRSKISDDTSALFDKFVCAANTGDLTTVLKMLSDGIVHADGLGTDKWGCRSALYIACRVGNLETVQALIRAGADVNLSSWPDKETALHAACRSARSVGVVEALVDAGADVNTRNNVGETALILILRLKKTSKKERFEKMFGIVSLLLNANCDVNVEVDGKSALFYACEGNIYGDILRLLIASGADLTK